ncbi:hypothetical protein NTE_02047 [Candidatus Nitrososphaera evergladensis SR1]|jgi:hypothetical protein|uniref:Uncharacterized protein n=1 Tax=Candidatus Nitrososphaera evergladensis SR1 TaxID=1459636 RepID=A0A075MXT3_9ARCH|nr:hypothetical protein [Candidatus Nitrososphaera evergladensis]AIF84104.1 hypothetical protein NTE_02047 [Candidatus Nitrososphaera evergladensis SR1]
MKLETWISVGSIALSAMFVALILSFYNFLISQGENPSRIIDPAGLLVQEVAISAAPGIVLAGVVFVMSRTTGNKPAGLLLVASGAIMTAGMVAALGMLPQIHPQYVQGGVGIVPYVFAAAGAGVAGLGGYLAVTSKRSRYAGNLDDLR